MSKNLSHKPKLNSFGRKSKEKPQRKKKSIPKQLAQKLSKCLKHL